MPQIEQKLALSAYLKQSPALDNLQISPIGTDIPVYCAGGRRLPHGGAVIFHLDYTGPVRENIPSHAIVITAHGRKYVELFSQDHDDEQTTAADARAILDSLCHRAGCAPDGDGCRMKNK